MRNGNSQMTNQFGIYENDTVRARINFDVPLPKGTHLACATYTILTHHNKTFYPVQNIDEARSCFS